MCGFFEAKKQSFLRKFLCQTNAAGAKDTQPLVYRRDDCERTAWSANEDTGSANSFALSTALGSVPSQPQEAGLTSQPCF